MAYPTIDMQVGGTEIQVKGYLTRSETRALEDLRIAEADLLEETMKVISSHRVNDIIDTVARTLREYALGVIKAREPDPNEPEDMGESPRDIVMRLLTEAVDLIPGADPDGDIASFTAAFRSVDDRVAQLRIEMAKIAVVPAFHIDLVGEIGEYNTDDLANVAHDLTSEAQKLRINAVVKSLGFPTSGPSAS